MATAKKTTTAKKAAPKKKATPAKKAVAKTTTDNKVVVVAEAAAAAETAKKGSFLAAVGRRKSAIARVRLIKNGRGVVTVNGKKITDFFGTAELRGLVVAPLKAVGQDEALDVSAKVIGGGIRGQAEAIRLGISRALCDMDSASRTTLKKLGYLSRDPRVRERKKPGKRSARRSPQWSKR